MFDIFDLFDNYDFFGTPVSYRSELRCPKCGMTYGDFSRTGRLGCSECYKAFEKQLSGLLRQIHQNPVHSGKIPSNVRGRLSKKRRVEMLKSQLSDAVRNEDYEKAAALHKEILEIEKENG